MVVSEDDVYYTSSNQSKSNIRSFIWKWLRGILDTNPPPFFSKQQAVILWHVFVNSKELLCHSFDKSNLTW
jgi:hypothetical protein